MRIFAWIVCGMAALGSSALAGGNDNWTGSFVCAIRGQVPRTITLAQDGGIPYMKIEFGGNATGNFIEGAAIRHYNAATGATMLSLGLAQPTSIVVAADGTASIGNAGVSVPCQKK